MLRFRSPYDLIAALVAGLLFGFAVAGIAQGAGLRFAWLMEHFADPAEAGFYALGLSGMAAAAVAFFMYRQTLELLGPIWKNLLGIFRFLVLFLVLALFLEPELISREKLSTPPTVAVIHDDSESLSIQRDSSFLRKDYPAKLQGFVDALQTEEVSPRFFSFDRGLHPDADPDSLTFTGEGTDIAGALSGVQKLYANQNLGAVVLISDGISNTGSSPLYALQGFQQPVYTVLLGDTAARKDLGIAEVLYNEIAYLGNETPVKVRVRSQGYEQATTTVSIASGGKVLGSQRVNLTAANPEQTVDFMIEPARAGIQQFTITVSPLPDELTTRNNTRIIFMNVLETRVRIAMFGGFPHPDIGAMRNALGRDDRYQLSEFIHKSPSDWYVKPDRADLGETDLIILHNFPFGPQDAGVMDMIAAAVKDRNVPVMCWVGMNTHVPTLQSKLGDYLPLTSASVTNQSEEAQAVFKPDYRQHSTYTFDEDWIQLMNAAPPLFRNRSDWKARGDASVFATVRIKGIELDYPVYAIRNHLNRKSMMWLGENFWRMRAHAMIERQDFAAWDQWFYNNIQWLIVREDKRKFKVKPVKPLFTGSEPVRFRGEVYDDSYNPVSGVDIKMRVTGPEGKEEVYYLNETGDGRYFAELRNLGEGAYTYDAEGVKDDRVLGRDNGEFSVGRSNIEHLSLRADQALMQQLALRTGGKFIFARDLDQLPPEILSLGSLKPVVSYLSRRRDFHEYPPIFILLLVLLTLEWVLRKRNSLS